MSIVPSPRTISTYSAGSYDIGLALQETVACSRSGTISLAFHVSLHASPCSRIVESRVECLDMEELGDDECRRGIDYYGVLSLRKDCNDLEIKAAFRRLAILYNPVRQKDEKAETIFALVAEAYDVLSDPLRRTVYDQYGEHGLKNGVPGPEGFIKPYIYHGEPMRTYREFFGTESPYPDLVSAAAQFPAFLEFPEGRDMKRKEEPLIKTLYLTLKEVFFGGMKKMKLQRCVLVGDGKCKSEIEEAILTIPIKPGIPTGTRITFPEAGDQGPTKIPADVIFITEERPHEIFRREGPDLHATFDVFLREALTGTVITIRTLDERIIRVPITSIVKPGYRKQVLGEGLPLPENPKKKGNLILWFNIEFPVYLPVSKKNYVRKTFEVTSEFADNEDTEYIHRFILGKKMRENVDFGVPLRRHRDDEAHQMEYICDS